MTSAEKIFLSKHHGLGNDFLIAIEPAADLTPVDAIRWCDRRTGIGADGLIICEPLAEDIWSMLLFNADGSRAEISGNGIRCLAQAIALRCELDLTGEAEHCLKIRSDGGLRSVVLTGDRRSDTIQAKVDMGAARPGPEPSNKWAQAGVSIKQQGGVDIGNPHLIAEVEEPAAIDLATVGPLIEADYPDGLNVHLVAVNDRENVQLRTWERGAGITQACGSGACASVYQLNQWGLVDSNVEVAMPGGSVNVEIGDTVFLQGPATFIATLEVSR